MNQFLLFVFVLASTRKVYEKKLQKLLDQGPPQTTIITNTSSEQVQTHNSRNGSADSDQYSDKEEGRNHNTLLSVGHLVCVLPQAGTSTPFLLLRGNSLSLLFPSLLPLCLL